MKKINVTKSYLPDIDEYIEKIKLIWDNHYLTNYGPLNNELVEKLQNYLNVNNLHFVSNGTVALQLAVEAIGETKGEIITTPFTFIASSSSILWQQYKPVFVDIEPDHFNIDVTKIESKINNNTKAILAVHCFGFPCDVFTLEKIGKKHNIPIIYDAAHAFGTKFYDKSLLSYGDISCCSMHATKVFHSVEGGLVISNNNKYNKIINSIKNFGKDEDDYNFVGINAKNSEFHAAMGLCVLNHFDEIIQKRKEVYEIYVELLKDNVIIPSIPKDFEYNYIYFPVVFDSEEQLLKVFDNLSKQEISARRYFYPSLNTLKIFNSNDECPVSEDISKRIGCLPLDTYLEKEDIEKISNIILESL